MEEINFGVFLKRKREQLGVSQSELSAKVGLDRTHLSTLENRGNPNFTTIVAIASGLGLSLSQFFAEDTPPPKEPPRVEVIFGEAVSDKRYKSKVLGQFIPIPLVKRHELVMEGPPREDDVEDYFVIPPDWANHVSSQGLVCVETKQEPHELLMIDASARTPEDGMVYLMVSEDELVVGRAARVQGMMTLIRQEPETGDPLFILGRRGPRPHILGRVLYECKAGPLDSTHVK